MLQPTIPVSSLAQSSDTDSATSAVSATISWTGPTLYNTYQAYRFDAESKVKIMMKKERTEKKT
jgi:hypothetical protein